MSVCLVSLSLSLSLCVFKFMIEIVSMIFRGARYLTGENLEVVWAEFSTLS
jgi:hypothetical protein